MSYVVVDGVAVVVDVKLSVTLMKLTPEIQNKVVKKMSHKMKTTFFYGRLV